MKAAYNHFVFSSPELIPYFEAFVCKSNINKWKINEVGIRVWIVRADSTL
jgi:hypothetical protein